MKLYYSIYFLAAISLTASAERVDPSNSLGLASVIANSLVKGVPAADSYYSPKSGRNTVDSKRPDTHGLDNKPLEGDRNQMVFGYTIGGGSGSYSASAVGFGSTGGGGGGGGGGQVNLGGGAQTDLNPANQIGGGNSLSRGLASASNNPSGFSDGVSPSYNNGSNTSVAGVNFPPATTTTSNSANQIGGTPEPSTINTQSASQNSGSQTPTFETLFRPGTNILPTVSAPKTPISGSFAKNTAIEAPAQLNVGNSSSLFALNGLSGDSPSGKANKSSSEPSSYPSSVQNTPYQAPVNIFTGGGSGTSSGSAVASNPTSLEAPVTATNPTSSSPTSTTPSSTSSTPSSTTTAGTSTTSTPASSTSTTSGANPSATTTSASNSGATPSTTSTPASTTHTGGATPAVAPTTGTPVVTASNSTSSSPEATTSGANLSSTGSGTAAPESQRSSGGTPSLADFDETGTLPRGINKIALNSNNFQFDKSNGTTDISNGVTVKTCIDKLNSYINSSTFTRSVDPTRNTVLNCVNSNSFNYQTNQSDFYDELEKYYNKECSKLKNDPDYNKLMSFVDLKDKNSVDPHIPPADYYEKLKELKEKYSPNSESGQLYINRCANVYRLLDKYRHYKKVGKTVVEEGLPATNKSAAPSSSQQNHSSTVSPVKVSTPPEASDD